MLFPFFLPIKSPQLPLPHSVSTIQVAHNIPWISIFSASLSNRESHFFSFVAQMIQMSIRLLKIDDVFGILSKQIQSIYSPYPSLFLSNLVEFLAWPVRFDFPHKFAGQSSRPSMQLLPTRSYSSFSLLRCVYSIILLNMVPFSLKFYLNLSRSYELHFIFMIFEIRYSIWFD